MKNTLKNIIIKCNNNKMIDNKIGDKEMYNNLPILRNSMVI